jgi:hypothetical protein
MEDKVWLNSNSSQDQLNHKDSSPRASSHQARLTRGYSAAAMDSRLE